jgi:hypothetical protein
VVVAALVFLDVVADDAAVQAARVQQLRVHHVDQQPCNRLAVLLKLRDKQPARLGPQPYCAVLPAREPERLIARHRCNRPSVRFWNIPGRGAAAVGKRPHRAISIPTRALLLPGAHAHCCSCRQAFAYHSVVAQAERSKDSAGIDAVNNVGAAAVESEGYDGSGGVLRQERWLKRLNVNPVPASHTHKSKTVS